MKEKTTDGEEEALRNMIVAAMNGRMPVSSPSLGSPRMTGGALKTLYLNDTTFGLQHVIALCSALQYGCAVERLQLRKILNSMNDVDRWKS